MSKYPTERGGCRKPTFSHVNYFPFNWRLDEVGMTAFAVAAVDFLVWQIELNAENGSVRSSSAEKPT
jgi:hypothetical protein